MRCPHCGAEFKTSRGAKPGSGAGNHRIDIAGQRFGRLTVIGFSHVSNEKAFWHCRCDCGNEKTASGSMLRQGKVRSCGCLITLSRNKRRPHPPLYTQGETGETVASERLDIEEQHLRKDAKALARKSWGP